MAFIDNQMTVIGYDIRDFTISDKALDQRHIDDPGRLPSPAADNADLLRVDVQEGSQAFDPLIEQFAPMNENKRISGALCDERCCDNRLAKGGRGGKHAVIMGNKSVEGLQLWPSQFALEGQFQRAAACRFRDDLPK